MKKFIILSGAYINAGDFLIEKRSKELLMHHIPDAKISVLNRVNVDYSDRIEFLNSFDAIIFAGGPIYHPSIYPKSLPFVNNLEEISSSVFFMGGGLYTGIYKSTISNDTKKFFRLGNNHGQPLSCRDFYTLRFLKHQGFNNLLMTGCPAWYNLNYVDKLNLEDHNHSRPKICVSEPASESNVKLLGELLKYLRTHFSDASIYLIIHRENKKSIEGIIKSLSAKCDITILEISNSANGFMVYDDCDLHIGFRVHAHLYNLSIRNKSILISEDVRGHGMCHALGLECIDKFPDSFPKQRKIMGGFYLNYSPSIYSNNNIVIKKIDDYLEYCELVGYTNYIEAFRRMNLYYQEMQKFIEMI